MMPRHMSFAATIPQIRNRSKTITRRRGWRKLEPGTEIWAVEKGQGLKKGEKVNRIALLEIVDVRVEALWRVHARFGETAKEGFPEMLPSEFVEFYCQMNGGTQDQLVTRIEFRYSEQGSIR